MKKIFRLSVVLASLLLAFGCEATFFDHYMEAPADVRCKSDQSMLTSLEVYFSATESADNPVVSYTIQLLKSVKDNPNISNSSVTKTVKSIDDATFTKLVTGRCYYARVRVNYQNGVSKWAVSENRVKIGKGEVSASEPEDDIPNYNQIFYTTTDGKIISSHSNINGIPIISNVYEDGMGIITVENESIGTISEFFNNEERLTSVKVPNIDTIEHSFTGCKNLQQFSYYRWYEIGDGYISDCYLACKNWLVAFAPSSGDITFTIPSDIHVISTQAFKGCTNLESVMIHGDLSSIGSSAFYGCSNLSAIYINAINPPSLESNSFSNCNSNLKIYVPLASLSAYKSADGWREYADKILSSDNLAEHSWSIVGTHNNWDTATGTEMTNIGDYAVANYVTFDSNAEFKFVANKSWDISYGMGSSSSTIILGNKYNGVFGGDSANIKVSAGTYCIKFSLIDASFVVEDALSSTSPENQIWYTSTDGKVVTPHSANVFGANIVSNIYKDNMGVIIFDAPVTKIGDEAFYNCSKLASITIPAKVTTIGDKALFLCHALEEITIPDSVTSIGQSAISSCNNLMQFKGKFASPDGRCLIVNGRLVSFAPAGVVSYTIPNGVTSIDKQAFYGGRGGLASVVIPDSVSTIGQWAFSETPTLTDVIIGSGVTSIDYGAFSACGSLTRVYCHATTPPTLGQSVFNANVNGRKIYVPASSVDAYKSDATWSSYASDIVADTTVPSNQIHYTSTDGKVITTYSTNAFGADIVSNTYNNGLGVITFNGAVIAIGSDAFRDCTTLASISIPYSATSIGYMAFNGCTELSSVVIPNSVQYIGWHAFGSCRNLTTIELGTGLTTIDYCAFDGCPSLTSITIPDSVTTIGHSILRSCQNLTAIYGKFASSDNRCLIVDGTLNSFAPSGLTNYTIPSEVTTIGEESMKYNSLQSITIPNGVIAIERGALAYSSITDITLPNTLQTIGGEAFYDCDNLTSITIPDSVTSIVSNPFFGCDRLATFYGKYATDDNKALIVDNTLVSVVNTLTSYSIPENVTAIAGWAMASNNNLTTVTIPAGVTAIGPRCFAGSNNLSGVYCKPTTPPYIGFDYPGETFPNPQYAPNLKIYVPAESVSAYKSADEWSNFANVIVAEEGSSDENRKIYYTSTDGNVVTPYATNVFGANIVSNTYENGQGVITFDGAVTSIGKNAFSHCSSLTSVTIPNSVTSIGNDAFNYCSSLTSVTIPNSVISIGAYAFNSCSSLTSVIIGNSVTSIGYGAFYNCSSLTSVTIPDSVTSIMDDAFGSCNNLAEFNGKFASADKRCLIVNGTLHSFAPAGLTEYTIPDSVTKIGWCIFQNYHSITSITIPNSVTSIGESAFANCGLTSVTIPDSVTSIKDGAFSGCDNLAEFNGKFASTDKRCLIVNGTLNSFAPAGLTVYTIPNSVTAIGNAAFYSCGKLCSVTIPDSVTSIGGQAFDYCSKLIEVFCKPTTPPTLSGTSVFYNNATGRKIYVPAASVETYKNANYWNEYADAIVAEDGSSDENRKIYYTSTDGKVITPYSTNAFGANIVSNTYENGQGVITFDTAVTQIGTDAFRECATLSSIELPNCVTSIGNSAFSGCSNLISVTIGNSVTEIGLYAFEECSSLKDVYYTGDISAWCKISFKNYYANPLYNGAKLYIDNKEVTEVTIPSDITEIKNYTFQGCTSLASVTIPDSVTSIGNSAFSGCSNLTSVTIGNSVTTIGSYAFSNCSSLTSITIPDRVTEIRYYAFSNCSSLTSITIPDSVTSIGSNAFYNCSSITSVTIGNSVTSIGRSAFENCSSLKDVYYTGDISAWCKISFEDSVANPLYYGAKLYIDNKEVTEVTIPSDITEIKNCTFRGCTSLASITIPDSVTTIGNYAFYSCSGLTSVTIGNSVTSIGSYAFRNCTSLASITIPDNVTEIGMYAFSGCSGLTAVTIGNGVTSIGESAFKDCTSLASVTIPDSVTSIGSSAFYNCSSLVSVYCKPTTPPILGTMAFNKNAADRKIYVPAASVNAYKTANNWNAYTDAIVAEGQGITPGGDFNENNYPGEL